MRSFIPILLLITALPIVCLSQNSEADTSFSTANTINGKSLRFISDKYGELTGTIDRQTIKLLTRMQRKEAKLQRKMQGIDSTKAQQLFVNSQAKYQQLQAKLQSPINPDIANPLKEYSPGIDSLATLMHFLSSPNTMLPVPAVKLAQIQQVSIQIQLLQGRLQQANEVQQFIKEREQQLKDQLSPCGLGKQLLGINKEAYYYQERLRQYKELINDKQKLEEAVFAKVRELPAFQHFMQQNSLLAQLFPMPENFGTPAALTGLQTRAQVQGIISQRIPGAFTPTAGTGGGSNYLQQQLQQAQTQLSSLKDKINKLGGGSSDMTMPDFIPDHQKTKPFFSRLTYGINFQTAQATQILPAISDIGLSLGYRLSDKATMGIGVSYKLGLGRGFNHIAFTNQGVGFRGFADIKAKGSIWITVGAEYNYMQAFRKFSDIRNIDIWQRSALVGITKKYSIGKKREGNIQLLYDLLYKQQVPRGQALKFRTGFNF